MSDEKKNLCQLALEGSEQYKQGHSSYVQFFPNGEIQSACYLGLAAIAAGAEAMALKRLRAEGDYDDSYYDYPDTLENTVDDLVKQLLDYGTYIVHDGDQIPTTPRVTACIFTDCPADFVHSDRLGMIAHLNDHHRFTVERINACLELLGWC